MTDTTDVTQEPAPSESDRFVQILSELNPAAMLADGLDDAIIGYAGRCGMDPVAVYDRQKCIEVLMREEKVTHHVASEWMDFNVEGAYVGEGTPLFFVSKAATIE